MPLLAAPNPQELRDAACLENVDRLSGDPATSAFKAAARLHQSRWWSPGRTDLACLGNRTSFDVAFILDLGQGERGVLGVETKYHEHPTPVGIRPQNLARYLEVSRASGLFEEQDW